MGIDNCNLQTRSPSSLCRISNDRVVKDYPYNNNVLPKAREGVRRGPKNPQDPHYLDQPKGPIPREGLPGAHWACEGKGSPRQGPCSAANQDPQGHHQKDPLWSIRNIMLKMDLVTPSVMCPLVMSSHRF